MMNRASKPDAPQGIPDKQEETSSEGQAASPPSPSRLPTPLHPLLFAAFPILNLYSHNIGEVSLKELWQPLGFALLGTVVAWALFALLTRHVRKAAIAATVASLIFFSYGHIANLLPRNQRDLTAPLCIVGLVILFFLLFRSRGTLGGATAILNVAAVGLLLPSLLTMGSRLAANASGRDKNAALAAHLVFRREGDKKEGEMPNTGAAASSPPIVPGPKPVSAAEAAKLPDIYYIILDAYGRADRLKTFYDFDNAPFVQALESRGFYVAHHSRSNYDQTGYCLPAYLNMNYWDVLLRGKNKDDAFEVERKLIDENAVAAFLRGVGYHYVYIWTGTGVSRVDTADLELDDNTLTPPESFAEEVFSLTALAAAPPPPQIFHVQEAKYGEHRAYIETAFKNLDSVARLPYPKFVFAHILAPHPPFVFGPHGEAINPHYVYSEDDASQLMQRLTRPQYIQGYAGQLQYINQRILEAVDAILRQSSHPPIIIIQGDHGSRMNLDWESLARTDLREPFSILNAYFVPPHVRERLYDTITPVNSFRIVLSAQFGANYPPLPDRSFFALADHAFEFTDVTDMIEQGKNAVPKSSRPDVSGGQGQSLSPH